MELYKKGSRGAMVRRIQQAVGCYPDGIFGGLTEEAVKTWQRDNGLTADGIVGARTLAVMFSRIVGLKKSRREITDIVLHCTASREGVPLTVEDIRRTCNNVCASPFRAQAGELWVKNEKVMCGYISEDTRVRLI